MAILPLAAALAGLLIGLRARALVVRHSVAEGGALRDGCPSCTAPLPGLPGPRGSDLRAAVAARCRDCSVRLGPPPLAVEAVTALLLGALAWKAAAGEARPAELAELLAFCWLAVLCAVLAFVDLAVRRLPDRFTIAACLGTGGLLAVAAASGGRWGDLLGAGLGGLALAAFYLLLFLVNPAGMGLGDVKLAAALGVGLGWFGWDILVAGAFFGFLAGALYGVALIAVRRGNRKSEFPFGPFMIIGAFAAILTAPVP
ncbi:prepilin peptidase [Planobispora rosea]|uniref:Prepilin peptidase n=1 Tax=Planobispora rosea TaxID=35762 RepID=A0A8J3RX24_PLARO|nr:A24 family peptidase [Planobispora rosea]GGS85460.1 prepilin peptidase [Planobispora rosea]GIH83392.1 prepilin peptidase [Planobispora rosea]